MITVEHESSMQTIWEHEMIRDICSCKELSEAAWAAHERINPVSENPRRGSRKESLGKGSPRGREYRRTRRECGD